MRVDAVGLSCPEPVLMLQKALGDKPETLEIAVDNAAAQGNCARFAVHAGYKVDIMQEGAAWILHLTK